MIVIFMIYTDEYYLIQLVIEDFFFPYGKLKFLGDVASNSLIIFRSVTYFRSPEVHEKEALLFDSFETVGYLVRVEIGHQDSGG